MNYFLIGMPGSGKSTLGKELSKALDLIYIDLDEWIEAKEGMSIPDLFSQFGQDYFRRKETEALQTLISENDQALISTGGGTPFFNNNMTLINSSGTSIFINVPLDELFKRLRLGKQNRPLVQGLSDNDLLNKLESMLVDRLPYYNQAHIRLSGDNLTVKEILTALEMKS